MCNRANKSLSEMIRSLSVVALRCISSACTTESILESTVLLTQLEIGLALELYLFSSMRSIVYYLESIVYSLSTSLYIVIRGFFSRRVV